MTKEKKYKCSICNEETTQAHIFINNLNAKVKPRGQTWYKNYKFKNVCDDCSSDFANELYRRFGKKYKIVDPYIKFMKYMPWLFVISTIMMVLWWVLRIY
jgi:hypothetical protein